MSSLVSVNPELAKEWHPTKNGSLKPDDVSPNSTTKVWWLGACGHEWYQSVHNRNKNGGRGCPICAHKIVASGINDLKTLFPGIAAEWHPVKNGSMQPSEAFPYSNKKVWWLGKCGHEYEASPNNRVNGKGCPYCAGNKVLPGFNDLASQLPEMAAQWNYEKNGPLIPERIHAQSNKKVWWKCDKGHEWNVSLTSRFSRDRNHIAGCPYCTNRLVLPGFNDLETRFPALAKEWDYEKNNCNPSEVLAGAVKQIYWKCSFGHSWRASIVSRTHMHSGCPVCDRERHTSFAEQALFYYIKQQFPDAVSRSTEVIGQEIDIWIPSQMTGIEYDGIFWHQNKNRDSEKNKKCIDKGIRLIRVQEAGLPTFEDCICVQKEDLQDSIVEVLSILNCSNIEVTLDQDERKILNNYLSIIKANSISVLYPDLLEEWDYEANGSIIPDMIQPGSHRKYAWVCKKCGNRWIAPVYTRTKMGCGCPECGLKRQIQTFKDNHLKKSISLAEEHPELCREWDYSKNELRPDCVTSGSNEKAWWICKNGHSFEAVIANRAKRHTADGAYSGCPICALKKQGLQKSIKTAQLKGSLYDLYPDLAAEYDEEKNELSSREITPGSIRKVWWKCKNGHEWEAYITNRVRRKTPCPICKKAIAEMRKQSGK